MDDLLKSLAAAPLANPLRINIPAGKLPAPRYVRPEYEGDLAPEKLTGAELKERRVNAHSAKICALLDYYATSTVPFDRIRDHTKLSDAEVINAMKQRGRTA